MRTEGFKSLTFDVKYWPGMQGDNPDRMELTDMRDIEIISQRLFMDPTVSAYQITVAKSSGEE